MRPPRVWLPAWVTPRFLYALAVIGVLAACAPGVPLFVPLAIAGGAVLAAAAVADALLGPRPGAVAVRRVVAPHMALRSPAELAYSIENRSPRAVRAGILETPARTLRFDVDDVVADVPARSRTTVARPVTPIARGPDTLTTMYVWYENGLGLLRRRLRVPASQQIRVFPDLSAVERYGTLRVRNRLIEAGLRKMHLRGTGTEFESLREWADGDAFRSIDWKASARRGKLMVAQYEVERSQNVLLVLDCGRLMTPRVGQQRKLDYAVTAALSLAAVAALASDRVGAVAFARDILAARAPRSARSSATRLADLLYDLEPRFEEANYTRAFAYLRHHLHKRSLIVFLTDAIDPLGQSALLGEVSALARRHVFVCVFMNDAAIAAGLAREPSNVDDAYRSSVALDLAAQRRAGVTMLERAGAIVVDVPASKLTTALIDEYLRIKQRGLV